MALFIFGFSALAIGAGGSGTVKGRLVRADGTPQGGGIFFLYNVQTGPPPLPAGYFRYPDGLDFIDDDGQFSATIPVGEYWYGASRKPQGGLDTVPALSDWLYLSRSVEGFLSLKMEPGATIELGDLTTGEILPGLAGDDQVVELTGTVFDQENVPLVNCLVEVYGQHEEMISLLFKSSLTEGDGRYSIKVAPGEYTIRVRRQSGPNRNGVRNKSAQQYVLPEPVEVAIAADKPVVELTFTVTDKSKLVSLH